MKRNSALIIAGILLLSLVVQIGAAEAQPKFTIENSTQNVFEVDLYGNVWANQTLTAQGLELPDDTIEEGDILFSTACASGNHYYLNGNDLACEADDKGIDSLTLEGDSGSETLGDGDTITIIGGSGGIDVAVTATDTATITFDWTEVGNDAIAEAKIDFDTACAAGNHYYLNGNNLACEADATNTSEEMQDAVGAIVTSGDGVDITYNDGGNTITTTFDCSDAIDADKGLVCNGENLNAYLPTCGAGNHLYNDGGNFSCEADDDTTYTNASWELNEITNAECANCITDANVVNTISVGPGSAINLANTYTGTIGPGNFTPCGSDEIYKESGGAMTCQADATGADGYSVHEAIAPLENDTTNIWLNDIFTNQSGDIMTGNLQMGSASSPVNITMNGSVESQIQDYESNAWISFDGLGGIVIHLEA